MIKKKVKDVSLYNRGSSENTKFTTNTKSRKKGLQTNHLRTAESLWIVQKPIKYAKRVDIMSLSIVTEAVMIFTLEPGISTQ